MGNLRWEKYRAGGTETTRMERRVGAPYFPGFVYKMGFPGRSSLFICYYFSYLFVQSVLWMFNDGCRSVLMTTL